MSQADLDVLRAEIETLKRRPVYRAPQIVLARGPRDVAAAQPVPSDEQLRRIQEESAAAAAERCASRLAHERIDPAWSAHTVDDIRATLRSQVPAATLLDAECGSSLCKVVVSHASVTEQRDFGILVADLDPFKIGAVVRYHEDRSPPTTEMYVVRAGSSFPGPDESQ